MAEMVEVYEKLGLFYVGQDVDKDTQETTDALTLLKNKNFTTHAAIIGMTGSGKTGLGIGLIEEAAIDNIPAIVIDPKGDMSNLLYADPTFSAETFRPWVEEEAKAKDKDVGEYAAKTAAMWKGGIESHHQDASRVTKFAMVEKTIYTPGSSAGIGVNVLSSLETPPPEIMEDSDAFAAYIKTTVSSLLSLVSIEADPVESKEYILLAQLISAAWVNNENLSLEDLIGRIISPPFKKIGVLPLEAFYPQNDRFKFATKFNAIIASPTFKAWMEGETLDIQRMLYDHSGKAKIAIFSIAHLNDDERMFFVTLLLNKYIAWMRRQSGASSLKTVLYMDEIYGFFPPTKNPPSKEPMLLLLKQARAFGVGIILSTQNPVDLDYKGLSNIGTWFVGRLQTTQDIERVIDGLGGKTGSSFNKKEISALLANLKKRTFFLKSAHLDDIRLFGTRWVMSYLKGPLKRAEIAELMADKKAQLTAASAANTAVNATNTTQGVMSTPTADAQDDGFDSYAAVDSSIPQLFRFNLGESTHYYPQVVAKVNLHFNDQRRNIDIDENLCIKLTLHESDQDLNWEDAKQESDAAQCLERLPSKAPSEIRYAPVPEIVSNDKKLSKTTKEVANWAYHTHRLPLFRCKAPKMESEPYETLGDFKVRVNDALNDLKEEEIDELKERYEKKEKTLTDRLERALLQVDKEKSDSTSSYMSAGLTVLGALFGKSRRSIGTAASRMMKERGDIGRAEAKVSKVEEDIEELNEELEDKINELADKFTLDNITIEEFAIKLRRTDIEIDQIALVWSAE